MPYILDTSADLSNIATGLSIAVPNGCTLFSLLGKTLAKSLQNWAIPTEPSIVTGSPTILPASGMTGDVNDYITAGEGIQPGSETLFIVSSSAVSGTLPNASFSSMPLATVGDYNKGTSLVVNTGQYGISFFVGLAGGGDAQASITAGDGGLGASLALQQAVSKPQLYCAVIDTINGALTFSNMTQSGPSWTNTASFTAGAARVGTGNYRSSGGADQNCLTTLHAFAKYNRALSPGECAAVYAQMKSIMTIRGISI